MSNLVLGTVQFGIKYGIANKTGAPNQDEVSKILDFAWENGIRELDTAQAYGSAENVLGTYFKLNKKGFVIHSKFSLSNTSIDEAIAFSLKTLNINQLGFFFFHHFADYLKFTEMQIDFSQKKILGLGVSVYRENELEICLHDHQISAIQLPLNLLDCSEKKIKLITEAHTIGKKIYIRSVFLQGLFFMDPKTEIPLNLKTLENELTSLQELALEENLSMMELCLGFAKTIVPTDGILIGVDTLQQLKTNLQAWNTQLNPQINSKIQLIADRILDKSLLMPKNWK